MLHYNGSTWSASTVSLSFLYNLHGSSSTNVFAVGGYGGIYHYNGKLWIPLQKRATNTSLKAIWGSGATNIIAMGTSNSGGLHFDGKSWTLKGPAAGSAMWGVDASNVYSISNKSLYRFNGTSWGLLNIPSPDPLNGVWASNPTDVYLVGDKGAVVHFWGTGSTGMVSGTTKDLKSVWGSGRSDIFAAGEAGTIIHYDGAKWGGMTSGTTGDLEYVWGLGPSMVYAVGKLGVFKYNGILWAQMRSTNMYGIWGTGPSDLYTVGYNNGIYYYDGKAWSDQDSGNSWRLYAIWGSSSSDVYSVGMNGTILRRKVP